MARFFTDVQPAVSVEAERPGHHAQEPGFHRPEVKPPGQPARVRIRADQGDDRVADPDLGSQSGVREDAGEGGESVALAAGESCASAD